MKIRKIDSLEGVDSTPLKTVSSLEGVRSRREWVCPAGVDASKDTSQCRPVMIAALGALEPNETEEFTEEQYAAIEEEYDADPRNDRGYDPGLYADAYDLDGVSDEDRENPLHPAFNPSGPASNRLMPYSVEQEAADVAVAEERRRVRELEDIKCRYVTRGGRQRIMCEGVDPSSGTTLRGLLRERRVARTKAKAKRRRR